MVSEVDAGGAIKAIRERRKLSQRIVSRKLKLSKQRLSAWENGGNAMTLTTLLRLLDALDCDLSIVDRGGEFNIKVLK